MAACASSERQGGPHACEGVAEGVEGQEQGTGASVVGTSAATVSVLARAVDHLWVADRNLRRSHVARPAGVVQAIRYAAALLRQAGIPQADELAGELEVLAMADEVRWYSAHNLLPEYHDRARELLPPTIVRFLERLGL